MKKFTCPYCYADHSLDQCPLICTFSIAGNTNVPCPNKCRKDLSTQIVDPRDIGKCMKCTLASKKITCPTMQDRVIPRAFLDEVSLPIALLGSKASGKSNYIGVLVEEMSKRMSKKFNCSLSKTADPASYQLYKQFYREPLYDAHMVVTATDAGEARPMLFPLYFNDKKGNIRDIITLTFYDTAGENLDDNTTIETYNSYIPNSRGIILLLDPLQIPSVRRKLEADGVTNLPQKNTDIEQILSTIIDIIRNRKNLKKDIIDIPIALVFTKMDVLKEHGLIDQDSMLLGESQHEEYGCYVPNYFAQCEADMETLLVDILGDDGELSQLLKAFKTHAFFATSALGQNPDDMGMMADVPHPMNILDPLIWILHEHKIIPTMGK